MKGGTNLGDIGKIFDFLHQAGKLKSALRFSEIKDMPRESGADHSWRVALMAFMITLALFL